MGCTCTDLGVGCVPRFTWPVLYNCNTKPYATHQTLCLQNLTPLLRLLHPLFWYTSKDETIGFWNPLSCEPIWVRGDQVFGVRFDATTDNITSIKDFFPMMTFSLNISSLYIDNMSDKRQRERCWRGSTPAMPMLEGFRFMKRAWDPVNSTAVKQGQGHTRVYPGLAPRGVKTYVLLVWLCIDVMFTGRCYNGGVDWI
jgi:hypothetical protein